MGAAGVYGAALPRLGLGIALKVEDGDGASGSIALMAVLRSVLERFDGQVLAALPMDHLAADVRSDIRNTRGMMVGERRTEGGLSFVAKRRTTPDVLARSRTK